MDTFNSILPSTRQRPNRTAEDASTSTASQTTPKPGVGNTNARSEPVQPSTGSPGNNTSSQVQAPSILSAPATATLNDVTGPSTGKGGGALRSIDQRFQFNPSSGTFSLSIPIQVSKARKDFQPLLELSYNSGSGNGPFGMGWQLGCGEIAAVTRKTSKGIPRYEEDSDIFIFGSAEDLVLLDDQPASAARTVAGESYHVQQYRPRVETSGFQVIERWTNLRDAGDVFWRSISSSNVTSIFGRNDQSRVFDETSPGRKRIFSWLFCESYDAYGNAMILTYNAENDVGVRDLPATSQTCEMSRDTGARQRARYLKSVKYANRTPSRDLETWDIVPRGLSSSSESEDEWLFEVVLDYGEHELLRPTTNLQKAWSVRRDPYSTYTSGFEVRSYRLCRRILMFHHMPEELGLQDYLVSSYLMKYDERETGSCLVSVTKEGHIWDQDAGRYETQSLPPLSLCYSSLAYTSTQDLQIQSTKPRLLSQLAASQAGATDLKAQWIDLNGEGTSGLLVQLDGVWYYDRNEGPLEDPSIDDPNSDGETSSSISSSVKTPDRVGFPDALANHPTNPVSGSNYFEDLDGNGLQNLVVLDENGRMKGYHERVEGDKWTNFCEMESVLNLDPNENMSLLRFDITGNGLTDLVLMDQSCGQVRWHESLGKKGYTPERRTQSCGRPVFWDSPNGRVTTLLADMSGDGMTDIVQLANGRVSYWPNLGYGQFGPEIVMNHSPVFDASDDSFDPHRVYLADVDGSGTTDLVYLPPSTGGAMIYRNHCGNGFLAPDFVSCFPQVSDPASVFVIDLLGKGTSCLCWVDAVSRDDVVIRYLDLNSPLLPNSHSASSPTVSKPNVLVSYDNGVGLRKTISYWPSTKFYLQDERAGRPWKTRIPFPIHVVRKVVDEDLITKSLRTSKYHYHDGYFDGHDREFRGFGMVEQWEHEVILLAGGNRYQKPTCHTKLWFHTGAMTLDLSPCVSETYGQPRIASKLPSDLSVPGVYESYRSLKGMQLRSEVFGLDGTTKAGNPYMVTENSYEVLQLQQPKSMRRPGVFRVQPRETLTLTYERAAANPLIRHEMILEHNVFGDVVRSLDIAYGIKRSLLADEASRAAQERGEVIYTQVEYTNPIKEPDAFYKPGVAEISTSRILGLPTRCVLDFQHVVTEDFTQYAVKPASSFDADSWYLDSMDTTEKTMIPLRQTRVIYRSKDMMKPLDPGVQESFSLIHQLFELTLTDSRRQTAYDLDNTIKLPPERTSTSILQDDGGLVDLDDDGNWWSPSSITLFGKSASKRIQLSTARESFFSPTLTIDAFGSQSLVQLDRLSLLPCRWTDAAGNVVEASNDYRVLEPVDTTDPNGNRVSVLHDSLGRTIAFAQMGKSDDMTGESLDDVSTEPIKSEELAAFAENPTKAVAAKFLGKAGKRWLLEDDRTANLTSVGGTEVRPRFQVSLFRADQPDCKGDIVMTVSYFNGYSRGIQDVGLATWKSSGAKKWRFSGSAAFDADGNTIQLHQQFFAAESLFMPHANLQTPVTTKFYDALGRSVGELHPDHAWTKIVYDNAWSMREFGRKDTILTTDPREDPDVGKYLRCLSTSLFLPSWYERQVASNNNHTVSAAKKSAKFANTPIVTHTDARTRVLVRTLTDGVVHSSLKLRYDIEGNKGMEIDALGRVAQRNWYDSSGHRIRFDNMESGTTRTFYDCLGASILLVDSSGATKRQVKDKLRRNLETWVMEPGAKKEIRWSRTFYGDEDSFSESSVLKRNQRGRVVCRYDQSGVQSFDQYDFRGNCTSSSTRLAAEYRSSFHCTPTMELEPETWTSTAAFDSMNREYYATDATGVITIRRFNTLASLESVSTSDMSGSAECSERVTNIEYTPDGFACRVQFDNGSTTVYTYDTETRQLANKRTWREKDSKALEDITYTYDVLGRISHIEDRSHQDVFFRNRRIDASNDYIYDSFGRLIKATGREMVNVDGDSAVISSSMTAGGPAAPMNGDHLTRYTETYEYDMADNILKVVHETSDAKTANWTRNYEYVDIKTSNRLSYTKFRGQEEHYTYDTVGSITSMSGHSKMQWDCFHRLKSSARQKVKTKGAASSGAKVGGNYGEEAELAPESRRLPETTYFIYNDDGQRVRKVTDRCSAEPGAQPRRLKETLYLDACDIHRKYEGLALSRDAAPRDLKLEVHTSVIKEHPASNTQFLMIERKLNTSPLLRYTVSTSLELDSESLIVSYEEYSPFGSPTVSYHGRSIEAPSRYRFASYLRDVETGFHYCQARYYVTSLGRWLSPDPLDTIDGPNLYAYVANDPINFHDPTGTMHIIHPMPVVPVAQEGTDAENNKGGCCKDCVQPCCKATLKHCSNQISTKCCTVAVVSGLGGFFSAWTFSTGPTASLEQNSLNLSVGFFTSVALGLAGSVLWDVVKPPLDTEKLKKDLEASQKKHEEDKRVIDSLILKNENSEKTIKEVTVANDVLSQQNQKLEADKRDVEEENRNLKDENTTLKDEKEVLRDKNNDLQSENAALKMENEVRKRQINGSGDGQNRVLSGHRKGRSLDSNRLKYE
ncbi:hypothetical protein NLU13_0188 [Sarocladium strictum]|uniref:SpvB-domain-containing protein n=1 Tax=Sarocladium strictum TaxID=5046 RepID=A0AA39GNL0_SARSR|nr:hypothetical protein NLU13_0188 [Sarocladium strictum]